MKVAFKVRPEENYLKPLVERFLVEELPHTNAHSKDLVVDILTDILVSTGRIRLAAKPNPESLVMIRDIIRWAVGENKPIPILVPSGPKKPGLGGALDVAELSAMRILDCLDRQVRKFHEPGVDVRIRLEDETGIYLEGPEAFNDISSYCWAMVLLAKIINPIALHPFMETEISVGKMQDMALELQDLFFGVLIGSKPIEDLHAAGWKGPLSETLRYELDQRFKRVFPGLDESGRRMHSAKYLANTLARAKLGLDGRDEKWSPKGAVFISFTPPSADAPTVSTRMHYRTVPKNHSKLHLPYWRAKGMLKVCGGDVTYCVRHWGGKYETIPGTIELVREKYQILIQADVLID